MKKGVVVLLSGGLDSNVCLAHYLAQPVDKTGPVYALSFDYGQTSRKELECAAELCRAWRVPHVTMRLTLPSSDTEGEIPARNTIFLSHALGFALQYNCDTVAYGAEPDATYVDSSKPYIAAMDNVFNLHGVTLEAPVKYLRDKRDIVKAALNYGVPLHLCWSTRGTAIDGRCNTSRRFLDALKSIFRNIDPHVLLDELANLQCIEHGSKFALMYKHDRFGVLPFKWPAALMTLATLGSSTVMMHCTVYSTGSWSRCLRAAEELVPQTCVSLGYELTDDLHKLRSNALNCNSQAAIWGIKQALSLLPRSRYAPVLACKVVQGHLRAVCQQLGYAQPARGDVIHDIQLLTSV